MKRFLYQAGVKNAEGSQTFYIDAETQEAADARAAKDDTDGIHTNDVEVTDLSALEPAGETTVDDFGDFPPEKEPGAGLAGLLDALNRSITELGLVRLSVGAEDAAIISRARGVMHAVIVASAAMGDVPGTEPESVRHHDVPKG